MKKYDKYKDSGIEWIGEIPEHWDSFLFKRIISRIKDGSHGSFLRVDDGKLFLSAKNVYDNGLSFGENESLISESDYNEIVKNGFPQKNDILLTCVGTIGRCFVYNLEYPHAFQRSVTFIRLNKEIAYSYYYKFFIQSTYYQTQLISLAKTSAQSGVYMSDLTNTIIVFPPLNEQTAIANYLDQKTTQIDDLISKKQRLIELLHEERTAMINQAVTKGLNPNVKMKDSGIEWLGEIPEHWEEARIKNIVNIIGRIGFRGYTTADLVKKGEGAISLSPSNIKNHQLNINECTYLSWDKYHESPEIKIYENDIILVKTGSTIGKTAIIPSGTPEMTLNPQLVVFKDIKLEQRFLYYMMISNYFQGYFTVYTAGGSTPAISQEKINNFKIAFPSIEEQQNISKYIESEDSRINTIQYKTEQEIDLLKEYKTALISEVVTGKVKVI